MEIKKWGSSLGEWVLKIVESKQTDSEEFKAALAWFGREKLLSEYRKQKGLPIDLPKDTTEASSEGSPAIHAPGQSVHPGSDPEL